MSALKTTLIVTGVVVAIAGVGTLGYMYYDERKQRKLLSDDLSSVLKQFEEVDSQIDELRKAQEAGDALLSSKAFDEIITKHRERAEAKVRQATAKPGVKEGTVHYMRPEFRPKDQPEQPVDHEIDNSPEAVAGRKVPDVCTEDMVKGFISHILMTKLTTGHGMSEEAASALLGRHDSALDELAVGTLNGGYALTADNMAAAVEDAFNSLDVASPTFAAFVDDIAATVAALMRQRGNGAG